MRSVGAAGAAGAAGAVGGPVKAPVSATGALGATAWGPFGLLEPLGSLVSLCLRSRSYLSFARRASSAVACFRGRPMAFLGVRGASAMPS